MPAVHSGVFSLILRLVGIIMQTSLDMFKNNSQRDEYFRPSPLFSFIYPDNIDDIEPKRVLEDPPRQETDIMLVTIICTYLY